MEDEVRTIFVVEGHDHSYREVTPTNSQTMVYDKLFKVYYDYDPNQKLLLTEELRRVVLLV